MTLRTPVQAPICFEVTALNSSATGTAFEAGGVIDLAAYLDCLAPGQWLSAALTARLTVMANITLACLEELIANELLAAAASKALPVEALIADTHPVTIDASMAYSTRLWRVLYDVTVLTQQASAASLHPVIDKIRARNMLGAPSAAEALHMVVLAIHANQLLQNLPTAPTADWCA